MSVQEASTDGPAAAACGLSRRSVLTQSGIVFIAGVLAAGAGAAATAQPLAVSGSFTFPEWRAAMRAAILQAPPSDLGLRLWRRYLRDVDTQADADIPQLKWLAAPGLRLSAVGEASALARVGNDALAHHLASAPSAAGAAIVSLRDPNAAIEARRALEALNLRGLVIDAQEANALIDDVKYYPLYEAAAARAAPLILQAGHAPRTAPADYGAIYGSPGDAARPLMRLIFGGVFDRFSNLRVIASLGAGEAFWRMRMAQVYAGLRESGAAPAHPVSHYFERNVFLTQSSDASERDWLGPDAASAIRRTA